MENEHDTMENGGDRSPPPGFHFDPPYQLSDLLAAGFSDLGSFLGVVSLLAEAVGDASALDLVL